MKTQITKEVKKRYITTFHPSYFNVQEDINVGDKIKFTIDNPHSQSNGCASSKRINIQIDENDIITKITETFSEDNKMGTFICFTFDVLKVEKQ